MFPLARPRFLDILAAAVVLGEGRGPVERFAAWTCLVGTVGVIGASSAMHAELAPAAGAWEAALKTLYVVAVATALVLGTAISRRQRKTSARERAQSTDTVGAPTSGRLRAALRV